MNDTPDTPREEPLVWFAVRVKSGREAAAKQALSERRFDTFLPVETRLRRSLRGTRPVQNPLIPGLMFVGVGPDAPSIYTVVEVNLVQDVVRHANGVAAEIRRDKSGYHFVNDLRSRQEAGEFDHTPRAKKFQRGEKVRIMAGAWTGFIGSIISAPPGSRARVLLSGIFGGKSGVPVDPKYLAAA